MRGTIHTIVKKIQASGYFFFKLVTYGLYKKYGKDEI